MILDSLAYKRKRELDKYDLQRNVYVVETVHVFVNLLYIMLRRHSWHYAVPQLRGKLYLNY